MVKLKKAICGTNQKPRLSVFRSNNHIYIQAINDEEGKTLIACSTLNPEIQEENKNTSTCEAAHAVGLLFGKKFLENNIQQGIFDRNGKLYHGRIKALADGIRETGVIL